MTTGEYSIDELIKTFERHADEYDKWEKEHPNDLEKFNISKALHHICKEIKQIKDDAQKKLYRTDDNIILDLNTFNLFAIEDVPRGTFKVVGRDKNMQLWYLKKFRNREDAQLYLDEITAIWECKA